MQSKILNLGCGANKITGAVNVDSSPDAEVDIQMDLKEFPWFKLEEGFYEKVYFLHCIEHIEKVYWEMVFSEIWRVMAPGGELVLAYPEFEKILRAWLDNRQGMRDFWEAAIYGRQLYKGDYHVAAAHSPEMIELLQSLGFRLEKKMDEPKQDFNTVLILTKIDKPITYEEALNMEVFGEKP